MTSISNLSLALIQVDRVQTQQRSLNLLADQLSTGKKTDRFSGLGTDAINSKRSRANLTSIDAYIQNIDNADRRIQLMSNVLGEFKAQVADLDSALIGFTAQSLHNKGDVVTYDDPTTPEIEEVSVGVNTADVDAEFQNMQSLAKQLSTYIFDLMNTQDQDGNYVLAGAESQIEPLNNNNFLSSAMAAQISDWKDGTLTTDDFIANLSDRTTDNGNPDAFTDTIVGYNAALSEGNAGAVLARVSDRQSIEYTTLANEAPFRDILVGLSLLQSENLPPVADVYADGDSPYPAPPSVKGAPGATTADMTRNFFKLYNAVTEMVTNAIDDVDDSTFRVEGVRARINTIKERYSDERALLQSTISNIEDVEINEVAIKINAVSTQIEASYSVTARISQLSLVNFI